jgi:hypothetical protein
MMATGVEADSLLHATSEEIDGKDLIAGGDQV